MNNPEIQQKISDFLSTQGLTVIATIHPTQTPEAAVIHFAVTENLEIIFNTFSTYRKYTNLKNNSAVAFVFGGEEKITVQYEGIATELTSTNEAQYKALFFSKYPKAEKWNAFPETRWFIVSPQWVRYADLRNNHTHKQELNFLI